MLFSDKKLEFTCSREQEFWMIDKFLGYNYMKMGDALFVCLRSAVVRFGEQGYDTDKNRQDEAALRLHMITGIDIDQTSECMGEAVINRIKGLSPEKTHLMLRYLKILKIVKLFTKNK